MHIKSRFLLFPAFEKRDLDLRGMKEVLNSFCILSKRPILCAKNHSGCWGWKMLKVNKSHSFCLMITKLYPHFKVYNSMYYQKKRKDLRITTMIHFCASFQQKLKKIQKTFKINKNHRNMAFFGDFSDFLHVWLKTSGKMDHGCDP